LSEQCLVAGVRVTPYFTYFNIPHLTYFNIPRDVSLQLVKWQERVAYNR